MERPTKPVMWTDEEAGERLKKWVTEKDGNWHSLDGFSYWYSHGFKADFKVHQCYIENFLASLEMINGLFDITIDSLLHEINVICPIGRIEYTSDWIDKILSGQKTMDILSTQHACGYYELWDTEQQEVRGIAEVDCVQKWHGVDLIGMVVDYEKLSLTAISGVEAFVNRCGFDSKESFADYHRNSFQSVKYAITYHVVDMKGDGE